MLNIHQSSYILRWPYTTQNGTIALNQSAFLLMNTTKVYFKQKILFGTKSIQYFCFKKKIVNNGY